MYDFARDLRERGPAAAEAFNERSRGHPLGNLHPWESRLRATRHLGRLVDGYRIERAPVVRAADSTILERCFGPGWIAIGDAAASYDPLASRGLVGALASGLETASLVATPEARLAAWQARLEASFATYRAERARLYA